MKCTLDWLKEYVDFEDTVEGLSDRLTFAGLEVESVERTGGDFSGIVAGEVIQIEPHPNADKLRLCTVAYGADKPLRVVCGAPSVKTGGIYPFAPVGTVLPSGIKLKKAKIRGEESLGMLCAPDELNLPGGHSGLLELDPSVKPGTSLSDILGPPETVFELEITPNRPDCLSLIGIAREVAALYGKPLKKPAVDLNETGEPADREISVDVQDPVRCPRYTARVLKGARTGPSPDWMKRRLEACGIRSINNIVDITNYVLLETGHPLHAFDLRCIDDKTLVIRRARTGEKFTTLDGAEHRLDDPILVIADSKKAVALAGVMGGANSEIQDDTSSILLESAMFEPSGIRATAKALGLHTDSSYRFQRGVNPDTVDFASRRAADLLCRYAGASLCKGSVDIYPAPKAKRSVTVRRKAVCDLIGLSVPDDAMDAIFRSLEIQIKESDSLRAVLEIPTFRDDLEREVDLIEEVARLYGVDKIPEKLPVAEVIPGAHDDRIRAVNICRRHLTGLGAREIMNYTLVHHPLLDLFGKEDRAGREELPHPISSEQSVLRTSLIPQMVESLGRNCSRQIETAVFFEIGRTFQKTESGTVQTEKVSLGMMGPAGRGALDQRRPVTEEEVFLWIKGLVEKLFSARFIPVEFEPLTEDPVFDSGRAAAVFSDRKMIGKLGLVNAGARKEWRLNEPVGVAELDLEILIAGSGPGGEIADIPLYPAVDRDFAFIVDEPVRHEKILRAIRDAAPPELERVQLFDIFRGKAVGQGKKSLAYSFVYRSPSATLTDEAVNCFHETIGKHVCKAVPAVLREQ